MAKKNKGALNTQPKGFQLGQDEATLRKQQEIFQKRVDAGKTGKAVQNLAAVNQALGALNREPQPPQKPPITTPTLEQQQGFNEVSVGANDYLQQVLSTLQGQGQFNPGDYAAQRQAASDSVMNEFNRLNQGRFAHEDEMFRRQMAEQGIDENSEKYRYLQGQRDLARGSQIQGAQNAAFAAGQGEQAQAYNQAFNTYQAPLAQLNATIPFYGYQNQNFLQQGQQNWASGENSLDRSHQLGMQQGGFDFQREMAKLQQKYALQQIAATPRGGGGAPGLSMDDRFALMDREFYNNMVLSGLQNGQPMQTPGIGGGFAAGIGQGVGAGIAQGLAR